MLHSEAKHRYGAIKIVQLIQRFEEDCIGTTFLLFLYHPTAAAADRLCCLRGKTRVHIVRRLYLVLST